MQACSVDLRQRIVSALEEAGATIDSVAERFAVSAASVKRYKRQLHETGTLSAKPWPGRVSKIAPDQQERLKELVASRSDWTLERLCQAWKEETAVEVTISVMARTLSRLKITYKKEPPRQRARRKEASGICRGAKADRA